jgi:wyosine [tRNA(Phe)-imidazoG37] synthetase (radical SAM superfamily)
MAKHVYGPVPSRRLGRSLGVDLVPLKTCCLNCVYCQLGPTPVTTIERREYVAADEVVEEVRQRLAEGVPLDYITLAGSGEPTLNSSFGIIAERIKRFAQVPLALLTNGVLFYLPEVRASCRAIDVVIPNLDAGDEATFQRINRPHPGLTLEKHVQGLAALRDEFPGEIWLEVFLLAGINSADSDVQKLKEQIERIRPDRIQLNTAVRPPAEEFARPVPEARLEQIREMLGAAAEVIADIEALRKAPEMKATTQDVLELLRRRPCTLDDIASGLCVHLNEAVKYVRQLLKEGKLVEVREGTRTFFRVR